VRLWLLLPRGGRGAELRRFGLTAAFLAFGISGCLGGDDDLPTVSIGTPVSATSLDRPQLAVWRGGQIVVARANGSRARALVGDPDGFGFVAFQWEPVAWSPDGRRLAFTGQFGAADADEDIWVMRADGSGRRRLTSGGASFHPVWSPDGRRIYFAYGPDDHPKQVELSDGREEKPVWIRSMRPDGSDRRDVTSPVAGRFELPGSFSPDGRTLAFTRGTYRDLDRRGRAHNTQAVWVMRPDGSDAKEIAERAADPAFSPDGSRIAFATDRDQNGSLSYGDRVFYASEIYVMNADGTRPRRLTSTRARNEAQPAWMPSGARIAYQHGTDYQNAQVTTVVQANADGSCETPVFADAGIHTWYGGPAWRPGDARRGDGRLRC
jgi:Tol biopolymer transport system component